MCVDRLRASRPEAEMLRSLSDDVNTKDGEGTREAAVEVPGVTEKIEEPEGDEKAKGADADVADGHDGEGNEEEDPEEDPAISPK